MMLKCFRISNDAFIFISFVLFTVSSQRNCIVFVACVFEFQLILGVTVTLRNHDLKQHFFLARLLRILRVVQTLRILPTCCSSTHLVQQLHLERTQACFVSAKQKHHNTKRAAATSQLPTTTTRADEHPLAKSHSHRKTNNSNDPRRRLT